MHPGCSIRSRTAQWSISEIWLRGMSKSRSFHGELATGRGHGLIVPGPQRSKVHRRDNGNGLISCIAVIGFLLAISPALRRAFRYAAGFEVSARRRPLPESAPDRGCRSCYRRAKRKQGRHCNGNDNEPQREPLFSVKRVGLPVRVRRSTGCRLIFPPDRGRHDHHKQHVDQQPYAKDEQDDTHKSP